MMIRKVLQDHFKSVPHFVILTGQDWLFRPDR